MFSFAMNTTCDEGTPGARRAALELGPRSGMSCLHSKDSESPIPMFSVVLSGV